MSNYSKLAIITVCCTGLAIPLSADAENTRARAHHRHYEMKSGGCPVHRSAEGELVDCHGWRKRDGTIGWDNTCFNLPYLSSQFACSTLGGGNN